MPNIIAAVGNPNCGKTTLFNALTGSTQQVGNWPGVTVEKKLGSFRLEDQSYTIVDLPGVYMIGGVVEGSEDERVARDYILSGEPQVVLNIIDSYNLERNLYLTSQLLEMKVPVVVALNMMDLAEKSGVHINVQALSDFLGCPVVPLIASRKHGVEDVKRALAQALRNPSRPIAAPPHAPAVQHAIAAISPRLADAARKHQVHPDWVALKVLEGDSFADKLVSAELAPDIELHRKRIEEECGEEADIIIADGRYELVGKIMETCFHQHRKMSLALTRRVDRVVLNRFLGIPVFLFAMYIMFLFTINVGGAFIDFFDQAVGAIFVDGLGRWLSELGLPPVIVVVVTGIGSGIQTVATFIPIIACLFLFLSFLEDSGYMARAAFVMDRAMRAIGLPGKSFVPLIVGFGCNVPAIMATRTLENRRDRILTAMMAPFMSCGARLPVFALFAAAFFPENGQNIVFALYLLGLGFAVLTGLLLKTTVLQGDVSFFVMELPPYHLPTLRTVVLQAWQRLREFIFRAGQVIVPIVMILSFFNSLGVDGKFGKEGTQDSVLAIVSQAVIPVFRPMGVQDENWPAAVGLFTGIFAKEAVVGTLNTLYAQAGAQDAAEKGDAPLAQEADDTAEAGIAEALWAAVQTIPENFSGLASAFLDPLGLDVSYVSSASEAAQELEVGDGVFGAMVSRFDGAAGALAYMVLILLYTPCVAAAGAIRHETGWRWTVFAAAWTTTLGYVASVSVYQIGTFTNHPTQSLTILALCSAVLAAAVAGLRITARLQSRRMGGVVAIEPIKPGQ